jgi:hypothetical protein
VKPWTWITAADAPERVAFLEQFLARVHCEPVDSLHVMFAAVEPRVVSAAVVYRTVRTAVWYCEALNRETGSSARHMLIGETDVATILTHAERTVADCGWRIER